MKIVLMFALAALTAAAHAENASVDAKIAALEKKAATIGAQKKKYTREEIENQPKVLKKTGGFVDVAAKGTSVLVIDARAKAGGAPDQFRMIFEKLSKTHVEVEKTPLASTACPVAVVKERLAAVKAAYALIVVENDKTSGLSVQPEDRVVVINAAKYKEGSDPVRREERVLKELWRGLGFVGGLGYAPFKNDVLQPVFSVTELDGLEYQVMQPMNFMRMYERMAKFGVKRARHIPYRIAVTEGWASAPTNEYQKAVWDEVHKLPAEPIKIKPETKKVEK